MRSSARQAVLLAAGWAACGAPAPCDPSTCVELTAAAGATSSDAPAPGERVLSAREEALLGERWLDWVAGPRTPPGRIALTLCDSVTACPTPLATGQLLGQGTYGVHVALRIPRDGVWIGRYARRCETSGGTLPSEDVTREVALVPGDDGIFAAAVDRLDVGPSPWRGRCTLSLEVGEGERAQRYMLEASFAYGVP